MLSFPKIRRLHRGKLGHLRLFFAAAVGQALALALGLWIEQKLLDAVGHWNVSLQRPKQVGRDELMGTDVRRQPLSAISAQELMLVKLIVFLWVVVSQAGIAYLVLYRWHANHQRRKLADADAFAKQNHALVRTRDAVIFGLAKLAESRDPDTGQHLERIAIYSTMLATAMRRHPRFQAIITPSFLRLLEVSSALHDIGKVGVDDAILLKAGSLNEKERKAIELHTLIGGECLSQIEARLGASNFLQMAREIAYSHHERWDGTGYPAGLAGEEIPLAARIISVVDVYDALSVRRVYKKAFPHEKCVRIIREGAGTQFDPVIVDIFLLIENEFRKCAEKLADHFLPTELQSPDRDDSLMTPEQEEIVARTIESAEYLMVETQSSPRNLAPGFRIDPPQ